jgi:hypothetical protein
MLSAAARGRLFCGALYREIALTGQADSHAPHSRHASWSIVALPSPILMADTGHVLSHAPQPTQLSASTVAFAL